jgi:branched-chain amino acid transport system substrate-binding protein
VSASALAAGAGGLVAACGSGIKGGRWVVVGFDDQYRVYHAADGPLAGFASGEEFVLSTVRATFAYAKGFTAGGKKYKVNIIQADSQSSPNRASQVARQLILTTT